MWEFAVNFNLLQHTLWKNKSLWRQMSEINRGKLQKLVRFFWSSVLLSTQFCWLGYLMFELLASMFWPPLIRKIRLNIWGTQMYLFHCKINSHFQITMKKEVFYTNEYSALQIRKAPADVPTSLTISSSLRGNLPCTPHTLIYLGSQWCSLIKFMQCTVKIYPHIFYFCKNCGDLLVDAVSIKYF